MKFEDIVEGGVYRTTIPMRFSKQPESGLLYSQLVAEKSDVSVQVKFGTMVLVTTNDELSGEVMYRVVSPHRLQKIPRGSSEKAPVADATPVTLPPASASRETARAYHLTRLERDVRGIRDGINNAAKIGGTHISFRSPPGNAVWLKKVLREEGYIVTVDRKDSEFEYVSAYW